MTSVASPVALPTQAAESNMVVEIDHSVSTANKVQRSKTSDEISPNSCEVPQDDSSDDDELIVREVSCLSLDIQPEAVSGGEASNVAVHPLANLDRQEDVLQYNIECFNQSSIVSHDIGSTDSGVSLSKSTSIQPLDNADSAAGDNGNFGKTYVSKAEDTQSEYHIASYDCESTSSDDNDDFVMYEVEVSKPNADCSAMADLPSSENAVLNSNTNVIQEVSHGSTVVENETREPIAIHSQIPDDNDSDGFDIEHVVCLDSAAIQNIRRASRLVSSVEHSDSVGAGKSNMMSINDGKNNLEPRCEVVRFDEEIEEFLSGGFRRFGDLFEAQESSCAKFEEHFAILSSFDDDLQRGYRMSKGAGGQRKRHDTNGQTPVSSKRGCSVTRVKLAATNPCQFKALFAANQPIVVSGCAEDESESGNRPWGLATFTNLLGNERVVRLKLPGMSDSRRHSYVHVTASNFATWLGMGEKNRYALATCCADSIVGSHAGLLVEESLVRQQCRTGLRPHEACVGLLDMVWAPVGFSEADYDDDQCARTFSILSGTLVASCFCLTVDDNPKIMEFETARGDSVFVPCGWAIKFRHAATSTAAERGGDEYVLWVKKKWQLPSETVAA